MVDHVVNVCKALGLIPQHVPTHLYMHAHKLIRIADNGGDYFISEEFSKLKSNEISYEEKYLNVCLYLNL